MNIVKMATVPKAVYMFNAIPIKILVTFCTETQKSIPKYKWEQKRPHTAKSILNKNSNAGAIILLNFKKYYRAVTIKTAWYWHKNREDQWIRIEYPDINPHSYSQLIFDKGAQNALWRKDRLFNKCCWEKGIPTCRSLSFILYKNQSMWIKYLNIRPETLK
jgi:hypothetical protein